MEIFTQRLGTEETRKSRSCLYQPAVLSLGKLPSSSQNFHLHFVEWLLELRNNLSNNNISIHRQLQKLHIHTKRYLTARPFISPG